MSGAAGDASFRVAPSQGRSPAWPASYLTVGCLGLVTRPGDRGHSADHLPTGTWPHGGRVGPEHPQRSRARRELCVPRGNRGTAGQSGCHTVNTLQPYRTDPRQPHQRRHRRAPGPGWGEGVQGPSHLPLSIPTPCCFAKPRPWEAGDPGAPLSAHTPGPRAGVSQPHSCLRVSVLALLPGGGRSFLGHGNVAPCQYLPGEEFSWILADSQPQSFLRSPPFPPTPPRPGWGSSTSS